MRILSVEDDPGLALTLSTLLCGAGYSVETAFDGLPALVVVMLTGQYHPGVSSRNIDVYVAWLAAEAWKTASMR